jgi:hypothetical protein
MGCPFSLLELGLISLEKSPLDSPAPKIWGYDLLIILYHDLLSLSLAWRRYHVARLMPSAFHGFMAANVLPLSLSNGRPLFGFPVSLGNGLATGSDDAGALGLTAEDSVF